MPRLGVDDGTSRLRLLAPPLPNPGPCFYPESCSGQLELRTSEVDYVERQSNFLIDNMALLVVVGPSSLHVVFSGSQVWIFPRLFAHISWLCFSFP